MRPIQKELRKYASEERRKVNLRFFKTGKEHYGAGDQFIGVTVPDTRIVAGHFHDLPLNEIESLLHSPIHEERLLSLIILVGQYKKGDEKTKQTIYDFYMKHAQRVNNWDLVDSSADKIIGPYLEKRDRKILYRLAQSKNLWERRIAIVSTYHFIRQNQFDDTFTITEKLLEDSHDLIHKACGWMLRETGKRDAKALEEFLKTHYTKMPRTMLRYAIEKFPEAKRKAYLQGKV